MADSVHLLTIDPGPGCAAPCEHCGELCSWDGKAATGTTTSDADRHSSNKLGHPSVWKRCEKK